jgi:hypothetical protein
MKGVIQMSNQTVLLGTRYISDGRVRSLFVLACAGLFLIALAVSASAFQQPVNQQPPAQIVVPEVSQRAIQAQWRSSFTRDWWKQGRQNSDNVVQPFVNPMEPRPR